MLWMKKDDISGSAELILLFKKNKNKSVHPDSDNIMSAMLNP